LIGVLAFHNEICTHCIIAAVLSVILVITLILQQLSTTRATVLSTLTGIALVAAIGMFVPSEVPPPSWLKSIPQNIKEGGDPVTVVVLGAQMHVDCLRFQTEYEPELAKRHGAKVRYCYLDAATVSADVDPPTFVISAKGCTPRILYGLPHYPKIKDVLDGFLFRAVEVSVRSASR